MNQDYYSPTVYTKALKLVRRYVLNNCGNLQDVEDVLQDGFIIFFTNIKKQSFQLTVEPEYYIFGVCKNLWLKEIKRRSKIVEDCGHIDFHPDDNIDSIELVVRKERLLNIIDRNIKKLSEKCQEIFKFRKEGLSCDDISKRMNWKNRQISKDKIYRCKKRLLQITSEDREYINLSKLDN